MVPINEFETSTCNSHVDSGWTKLKVVSRKKKRAANMVAAYVEDESNSTSVAEEGDDSVDEIAARNENLKEEEEEEEKEEEKVSLAEAAAKINRPHLTVYLVKISEMYPMLPEWQLIKFVDYFGIAFCDVPFSWPEMFNNPPLFKLIDVIDVPLSHIPESVYKISVDWIQRQKLNTLCGFIWWALNKINGCLTELRGGPPHTYRKSQVSLFVTSAMVLRGQPSALARVLPPMRFKYSRYRVPDLLPVTVWMIAQASRGDLFMALYTWADTLLPAVDTNPHSRDLILQLVENILSQPNARTILVERAVFEDHGVIPPFSFESLLRLTFPDSSARVKTTARFEAIYPLLKELALAGTPGGEAMKKGARQIFIFSLRLAGEANPVLAKEATSIAIWALTENIVCCNHWDNLYENNLKASVALLKKLVDEWKDHSRKLSSSRSNTLTLNQTMKSFRLKNENAINEGGANASLYKEADESCKVILGRLSWKSTAITALVLAAVVVVLAAVVLSFKPEATTVLKKLLDSWIRISRRRKLKS